MKKVSVNDVKQLGTHVTGAISSMKYQILTVIILIFLIHYLNKLNKFHNP